MRSRIHKGHRPFFEWTPWFAWYPVPVYIHGTKTGSGGGSDWRWVWWEIVETKVQFSGGVEPYDVYRMPEAATRGD
jgi:hypothetical protein